MTYPNTQLFIDGQWRDAADGRTPGRVQPGHRPGNRPRAPTPAQADLDRALDAAQKGFETWRDTPAVERSKIMRKAAGLMRERAGDIAQLLTQEQGKPLAEAKGEAMAAADIIEWFAEEGLRVYGRIVPVARQPGAAPDGAERPGRPGGGLHAVELPDQPGGAQARRGAGRGLLDASSRRPKKRPAAAGATDSRLCRRRLAARRAGPGVRHAGRDFQLPDRAPRSSARSPSPAPRRWASNWRRWPAST